MTTRAAIGWRAKAFQGRFLDSGPEPYVSEMQGTAVISCSRGSSATANLGIVAEVSDAIERELRRGQSVDAAACIKPFMTLSVERLSAGLSTAGAAKGASTVAQLQMLVADGLAHGGIWVDGVGFVGLESVALVEGDGAWELASRFMRQVANRETDTRE
ncbi:hypothetical protein ATN79_45025 [Paraburkholderia caribensis]|nr:hypothetical protein ATN79_45025 [Paraburkholderia caribensis]